MLNIMIAVTPSAYACEGNETCDRQDVARKLSVQDVTNKAAEMGYEVRKVDTEDVCNEVYAIGKDGARVEICMNSVTGAVVKIKKRS